MRLQVFVLVLVVAASLPAAAADADRDRGRELFRQHCVGCHAIECDRIGPRLGGVIGRQAATVPHFAGYSADMTASGIVWTEETLDAFLTDPKGFLPKTAMSGYGKVDDAADRRAIIAFLAAPDTSLDLCF